MTNVRSGSKTETLDKYISLVNKQYIEIIRMRKTIKCLRNKIRTLECDCDNTDNHCKYKKAITVLFNEDQVTALINKKRVKNWSNDTIQRALQLKFLCGVHGYEALIDQGIPLPSIRTLSRKLEELKFNPGICQDMLEFLKYKKSAFIDEKDVECGLVFDEMSITDKQSLNSSTGATIGSITFPGQTGTATKALVFMLAGTCQRWKHIIGYHFTGSSIDGKILRDVIFQIILQVEQLGIHINFVTCDMGSGNMSFWKSLQISAGKLKEIRNSIVHPCDSISLISISSIIYHWRLTAYFKKLKICSCK